MDDGFKDMIFGKPRPPKCVPHIGLQPRHSIRRFIVKAKLAGMAKVSALVASSSRSAAADAHMNVSVPRYVPAGIHRLELYSPLAVSHLNATEKAFMI